ncbi:MAG: imidazolonepropionase, partial [Actinomycetota bacterium]
MTLLITGIGELVTNDQSYGNGILGIIQDAAVVIEDDKIAWVGQANKAPAADRRLDAQGKAVIPGFVDSHAHLVFDGERSKEFAARMTGEKYAAGGIRSTVAATRAASDETLEQNFLKLAGELRRSGITTFETKSGYGLTVSDEARSLAIASKHT